MGTTNQQPRIFDDAEAALLAGVWAGAETNNASDAEAVAKFRLFRKKAQEKSLRIIDVLELPEIIRAIDDQLQPQRHPCSKCATSEGALKETQAKLVERERQTRLLIERYEEDLVKAKTIMRKQRQQHMGALAFLGYMFGFTEWRMTLLLLVIGILIVPQNPLNHGWHVYALFVGGAWCFLLWCAAEVDGGWFRLLFKLAMLIAAAGWAKSNPALTWLIFGGTALLAATRLLNNIFDRLNAVPAIKNVTRFFL